MKLSTKFDYSSVAYNVDNTVHLLIQATAPKLDLEKDRIPLNLVATLDVSPSMSGPKIEYARKSLMKLIDHLSPNDTLGLVSFDSQVRTLFPVTKMSQQSKDGLKQILQKAGVSGGGTNLSGAMLEAINHANQIDGNSRIILFTDGQPNVGVRDSVQLQELLRQNMRKNLSLTSFGYGNDHDSQLLAALAEIGKGNYAYLQNPDDALTAFARELGGLLSCYSQNLKFTITPKDKTEILEVLSDVDVEEIPEGGVSISVADLYSEETRNIVLKLKLDRQPKSHPRATSVAEVVLKYDRMPEGKRHSEDTRAKVQFVKLQDVQQNANQEVVDQVGLCQIMKAQEQATAYATAGNFMMANTVLNNVTLGVTGIQGAAGSRGPSGNIGATMTTAKGYYDNHATFTNSSHLRSANAHSHQTGRASHQSNQGLYTSNTAMNVMMTAFAADDQSQGAAGIGNGASQGASHTHSLQNLQGNTGTSIQLGSQGISSGVLSTIGSTVTVTAGGSGVATALDGSVNGTQLPDGFSYKVQPDGGLVIMADAHPLNQTEANNKSTKTKSRSKKEW